MNKLEIITNNDFEIVFRSGNTEFTIDKNIIDNTYNFAISEGYTDIDGYPSVRIVNINLDRAAIEEIVKFIFVKKL